LSFSRFVRQRRATLILVTVLVLLVIIYLPTLLTQITGDGDSYLNDVGEFQVALNIWGTVHATGYPLFLMIGNVIVAALRALGVPAVTAPSLYAMLWGLIALGIFYALVLRLTARIEIAAVTTLLLGLTRSVWVHNVIAEEYAMNSAIELTLLAIALWPPGVTAQNVRKRVWWLALVGGIGVAHHRTVILMAPGLLWAVWPALHSQGRRMWATLGAALLIGLVGFLPYLYLPARAWAHGDWVYGDPGTLSGFWDQFTGKEASHLTHLPIDGQAWLNDIGDTFRILIAELTPVPALACAIGLVAATMLSRFRREARIVLWCIPGYLAFLFALHEVVKPQAVAMTVVIFLVLELAFALDTIRIVTRRFSPSLLAERGPGGEVSRIAVAGLFLAALPALTHFDYVYRLTHRDTGLNMIALASRTPRDGGKAVFMLPWGPRFHAVAFSKYVTKENADLPIVSHNTDFGVLVAQGSVIYTSKDTFYRFPLSWWDSRIGRAYLSSAADGLVAIRPAPLTEKPAGTAIDVAHGVVLHHVGLCLSDTAVHLTIGWGARQLPDADLSVFVHLLGGETMIAQADSSAPVYGWYPTSRWSAGEVVYDNYLLPRLPEATAVSFGMYEQPTPGQFVNYGTQNLSLQGVPACP
jgi:hypothetical protein